MVVSQSMSSSHSYSFDASSVGSSLNNMTVATRGSSSSFDSSSNNENNTNVNNNNTHTNNNDSNANNPQPGTTTTATATKGSKQQQQTQHPSSKKKRNKPQQSTNSPKQQQQQRARIDEIGESMARMLNESDAGFDYCSTESSRMQPKSRKRGRNDGNNISNHSSMDPFELDLDLGNDSFRPLFGPQNRYRIQVLARCFWILLRNFRACKLREYLFPKALPPSHEREQHEPEPPLYRALRFLGVVASLIFLGCLALATEVAFAAVATWRFGRLVAFVVSSLLVDWNEIASVCPWWTIAMGHKLLALLTRFDRVVLFGNRWRGREWNTNGFDFTDSIVLVNKPESSVKGKYLWQLPPPDALIRSSNMIPSPHGATAGGQTPRNNDQGRRKTTTSPQEGNRNDNTWGKHTTDHIETMDYCYIMLREEFIQRQFARLQRRKASYEETTVASKNSEISNKSKDKDTNDLLSSVSCLETFRQEFVLDPSINNIDPCEIDKVTGLSVKLQELLEGDDDSFDNDFDNTNNNVTTKYQRQTSLDTATHANKKDGRLRRTKSNDDAGSVGSESDGTTTDMNWMDVGTEIGMKLLGSSAVQKAMASDDTFDTINNLKVKMDSHFKKGNSTINTSNKSLDKLLDHPLSPSTIGGASHPATPYFDAEMPKFYDSMNSGAAFGGNVDTRTTGTTTDHHRRTPSGYHLDPYAQALPVNPMWTSAGAAAVSPTQSLTTLETNGTKDDSTLGSPPNNPDWQSSLLPSPSSPTAQLSKLSPRIKENNDDTDNTNDIVLPQIDVLSVSPTPRQSNKKLMSDKIMEKLPKMPKSLRRRKRKTQPATNEPAIELVCNGRAHDDNSEPLIHLLSPPASKSRRPVLLPGVKIAVPVLPINPDAPKQRSSSRKRRKERFQMATVVSSKRICVFEKNNMPQSGNRGTNCLTITVNLDKCFLRNGQFATMTLRIMDKWGSKYMPKHSKLPMGSCVATSFGLGVLVGWRVEDDVHIVRSLWQHRGSGSACAYLRRDSIHATMEAAVGFEANTTHGRGTVVGYVNGGPEFKSGRYFVAITEEGSRHHRHVLELNRMDVLSCESAKFIPTVEHIRAAAQYQLQIDRYNELRDAKSNYEEISNKMWGDFSKHFDILWKSFLRAIEEDHEFDDGMNEFIQNCVNFLNQLDSPDYEGTPFSPSGNGYDIDNFDASIYIHATDCSTSQCSSKNASSAIAAGDGEKPDSGFWLMNNMFEIFQSNRDAHDAEGDRDNPINLEGIEIQCTPRRRSDKNYARAFAMLRTLTKTVTLAKAACADEPSFKMGLSVCHEFLLFVKTVIKVQQKNMNHESLMIWRSAWDEIVAVFGPVHRRLRKIGEGIAERMEKHGRRAKVRLLRFVDIIVQDDVLFLALEQGDWTRCAQQFESAIVEANIIDEQSREHYRKTAQFLYNHFSSATSRSNGAADRNNEKMAQFLMAIQLFAAPRKALLELFLRDSVLEMLERIFVRAFSKDEVASRMLNIHCSNIQTLRQFRMLKDFTIAGKLWIPLLDAADEEFSWAVSKLPANAQEYLSPISSLFSLCVVQFHKMDEGDLTKDWLKFLMDEEAADIIYDLDMKLILALEQFSRDVRDTMVVLPYYPSIDDDILNLVDDINIDAFVKEASVALEDEGKLRKFIKEKATIMVERFLDYLPKMSIPVEKRDLANGWTLTCRGAGGGDLTLTELIIKRENLTCQVMGGDSLLFPAAAATLDDLENLPTNVSNVAAQLSMLMPSSPVKAIEENSILTVVRDIIVNAQNDGCYHIGEGGVQHPPSDKYAAAVLCNLPVSSVLNCAIDLWRNLEIDDDELLEIAIRDVSYQIQLNDGRVEVQSVGGSGTRQELYADPAPSSRLAEVDSWQISNASDSLDESGQRKPHRFNPRVDPTVLFLEIKKLTFNLENFMFRIEKHDSKKTIFDPAFEGMGSILVKNVLIKLRVECYKGYIRKPVGRDDVPVPVLQLSDLDVSLEQVKLEIHDTGADWLLNKIVDGFGDKFTDIISANLCEQIRKQMEEALTNINGYFEENPEVLLGVLDISLDDLDEATVFV